MTMRNQWRGYNRSHAVDSWKASSILSLIVAPVCITSRVPDINRQVRKCQNNAITILNMRRGQMLIEGFVFDDLPLPSSLLRGTGEAQLVKLNYTRGFFLLARMRQVVVPWKSSEWKELGTTLSRSTTVTFMLSSFSPSTTITANNTTI